MFLRVRGPLVCGPGFVLKFQQPRLTQSQHLTRLSTLNPDKSICIVINRQPTTLPPPLPPSLHPVCISISLPLLSRVRWNQCCHCLPPGAGGLWLYKQTGANRDPLPYRHPHGWLAEIRTRPSPGCVCNPRHYVPPRLVITGLPHLAPRFVCQRIAFAPPHMATTMCIFFFLATHAPHSGRRDCFSLQYIILMGRGHY